MMPGLEHRDGADGHRACAANLVVVTPGELDALFARADRPGPERATAQAELVAARRALLAGLLACVDDASRPRATRVRAAQLFGAAADIADAHAVAARLESPCDFEIAFALYEGVGGGECEYRRNVWRWSEVADVFAPLLTSPSRAARLLAAMLLPKITPHGAARARVVPALTDLSTDCSGPIGVLAALELARHGHTLRATVAEYGRALEDSGALVRAQLLRAADLFDAAIAPLLPRLAAMMRDDDPMVRSAALSALWIGYELHAERAGMEGLVPGERLPFRWVVEHAPEGDLTLAYKRAWTKCASPASMLAAAAGRVDLRSLVRATGACLRVAYDARRDNVPDEHPERAFDVLAAWCDGAADQDALAGAWNHHSAPRMGDGRGALGRRALYDAWLMVPNLASESRDGRDAFEIGVLTLLATCAALEEVCPDDLFDNASRRLADAVRTAIPALPDPPA